MSLGNGIPSRYPLDRPLDDDLGSWWVLHIKPNCEKQVATYLMNREISYYLPMYNKKIRVGYFKRARITELPLFRGYICFALEKKKHGQLYDTKKLVRIINVEDQDRFVRELQAVFRAVESGKDLTVNSGLVPGKRVVVVSGALAGTEGVILRRSKERSLALSVQMFNQTVILKIDPDTDVELVS